MEGDSEKTKISYFHHWINGEGMGHIESWKNNKTLIHQTENDGLEEHQKEGKYSSEQIESYFTLFESLLVPRSNPLLAVEELHFAKQGSMTSGEFHSHIVKIAKRCQFPNPEAEERSIRDAPARTEMSSQKYKVQGLSQNRMLPQGMPVQEKDQESQSCPDTTPRLR